MSQASEQLAQHHIDLPAALAMVAGALRWIPTISAPGAIVAGALEGAPWRVAAGLAGSLALLAAGVLPGAALMRLTVRAGESGGGQIGRARSPSRGTFAMLAPPLPRALGLLVAREIRYSVLNPQRLVSLLLTPLLVLVMSAGRSSRFAHPEFILAFMIASSASTASLLLFSYDGTGIRSLYLLPTPPRNVLLAKSIEFFLRVALQIVLASAVLLFALHRAPSGEFAAVLLGLPAIVLAILAVGTSFSIRYPTRVRQRGMGTRTGGWTGFAMMFVAALASLAVFGLGWLARRAVAPTAATPVSLGLYGLFALLAAALWWRSLDIHAVLLAEQREKLIEEIGRTAGD